MRTAALPGANKHLELINANCSNHFNYIIFVLNPLRILLSLSGLWFIHMYELNPSREFSPQTVGPCRILHCF